YRNRRLGDFLKEIKLTEGRLTGIQMVKAALLQNGSPEALFETDEDRTWFSVVLKPHPTFQNEDTTERSSSAPLPVLRDAIRDLVFARPIEAANQATAQATAQVTVQAADEELLEQFENILRLLTDNALAKQAIFSMLEVSNHRFNFNRFILPLINAGLVCQTLPDKPHSPLQRYALTEKATALFQVYAHR
ncbi:MAG: Fic family protein, partial [Rectinemataceae bacterium]